MKKTNIEEIADTLRIAWNKSTGTNKGQTWEILSEWARQGYIAVAKAAVECAGEKEKQYRMLEQSKDILSEGDEWRNPGHDVNEWKRIDNPEWFGKKDWHSTAEFRRPLSPSLQDVIDDQRFQIRDLEGKLAEVTAARDSWKSDSNRLQNTLDIAQRQNRDYFGEVENLRANTAALNNELRKTQADWEGVYSWIHSNVRGCVGRRCSEVTLELLQGKTLVDSRIEPLVAKIERIEKATTRLRGYREINSHDPALCIEDAAKVIADKAATIRRLKEKLENLEPVVDDWNKDHMEMKRKFDAAESYIEKLEQDLSFYRGVAEAIKGYEEVL